MNDSLLYFGLELQPTYFPSENPVLIFISLKNSFEKIISLQNPSSQQQQQFIDSLHCFISNAIFPAGELTELNWSNILENMNGIKQSLLFIFKGDLTKASEYISLVLDKKVSIEIDTCSDILSKSQSIILYNVCLSLCNSITEERLTVPLFTYHESIAQKQYDFEFFLHDNGFVYTLNFSKLLDNWKQNGAPEVLGMEAVDLLCQLLSSWDKSGVLSGAQDQCIKLFIDKNPEMKDVLSGFVSEDNARDACKLSQALVLRNLGSKCMDSIEELVIRVKPKLAIIFSYHNSSHNPPVDSCSVYFSPEQVHNSTQDVFPEEVFPEEVFPEGILGSPQITLCSLNTTAPQPENELTEQVSKTMRQIDCNFDPFDIFDESNECSNWLGGQSNPFDVYSASTDQQGRESTQQMNSSANATSEAPQGVYVVNTNDQSNVIEIDDSDEEEDSTSSNPEYPTRVTSSYVAPSQASSRERKKPPRAPTWKEEVNLYCIDASNELKLLRLDFSIKLKNTEFETHTIDLARDAIAQIKQGSKWLDVLTIKTLFDELNASRPTCPQKYEQFKCLISHIVKGSIENIYSCRFLHVRIENWTKLQKNLTLLNNKDLVKDVLSHLKIYSKNIDPVMLKNSALLKKKDFLQYRYLKSLISYFNDEITLKTLNLESMPYHEILTKPEYSSVQMHSVQQIDFERLLIEWKRDESQIPSFEHSEVKGLDFLCQLFIIHDTMFFDKDTFTFTKCKCECIKLFLNKNDKIKSILLKTLSACELTIDNKKFVIIMQLRTFNLHRYKQQKDKILNCIAPYLKSILTTKDLDGMDPESLHEIVHNAIQAPMSCMSANPGSIESASSKPACLVASQQEQRASSPSYQSPTSRSNAQNLPSQPIKKWNFKLVYLKTAQQSKKQRREGPK
jgi:hypothetical protein